MVIMERLLSLYGRLLGLMVIPSLPYPQDKQKHFLAGALQVNLFGWPVSWVLLSLSGWLHPSLPPEAQIIESICAALIGFMLSCWIGAWKERYDATQPMLHTVDPNDITATDWGAFVGLVSMVALALYLH
jgi:hypothetical protein